MKADTITISRGIANQIFHMAQDTPSAEGIIGGHGNQAQSFACVEKPDQNLSLHLERLASRGESVFATVHTAAQHQHPEAHLATLSARWPDAIRMLVLLDTKGVLELMAYRREHDHWHPLELRLEGPAD